MGDSAGLSGGRHLPSAAGGSRPVIGISSYREQARWGAWDTEVTLLPCRYTDRVAQAGGVPVLLPPLPGIDETLRRLDGLVLTGGGDVDPARYSTPRDRATAGIRPERDEAEIALVRRALSLGLPVLGICRGMQLINVVQGGTLHQHLPDVVGHDGHSPGPGSYGEHEVRVAPGSRLAGILGRAGPASDRPVVVPTHHHQGIDRLGARLTATAWAADGLIEAVELDSREHPFLVAVQWHPEASEDVSLFRALAAAAAASAAALTG